MFRGLALDPGPIQAACGYVRMLATQADFFITQDDIMNSCANAFRRMLTSTSQAYQVAISTPTDTLPKVIDEAALSIFSSLTESSRSNRNMMRGQGKMYDALKAVSMGKRSISEVDPPIAGARAKVGFQPLCVGFTFMSRLGSN